MSDPNIFIYAIAAVVLFFYLRKMWLRRSIPQYTPGTLEERMRSVQDYLLLDVRTEGERKLGTIRGSQHIPLHHIVKRLDELEKHKSKEIICFCQTGSRSISAALLLKKRGFKVANLVGGMAEWNFLHHK